MVSDTVTKVAPFNNLKANNQRKEDIFKQSANNRWSFTVCFECSQNLKRSFTLNCNDRDTTAILLLYRGGFKEKGPVSS